MSGNQEIRDAVRQLGRAVGTLVRAVAGALRRTPPAVPEPSVHSGPPQEWLDLVAESDPGWLARSQWADQSGRRGEEPEDRSRSRRQVTAATTAPSRQPSSTEDLRPDAVGPESRTASVRHLEPATASDDSADTPDPAVREHRTQATVPRLRRLLPVDSAEEDGQNPPRRVRPTTPDESATQDGSPRHRGALAGATRLTRVERPVEAAPDSAAAAASPEPAPSRPYNPSEALRPVPLRPLPTQELGPVLPEPAHRGSEGLPGPLPARVQELPGTWSPAPPLGRHPARVPSERPAAASAPRGPALPRTEGLEDAAAQAELGLAARLWQAEDRPDALTAAQRRS